jgi:hypothetical protein
MKNLPNLLVVALMSGWILLSNPATEICKAGDQNFTPSDADPVFNFGDLSVENNFADLPMLSANTPQLNSAFYLDDAASYPAAQNKSDADQEADLAKKTLNPVADLISIPFQYNADFDLGPNDATRSLLNIQPVIPFSITPDWNLITRTILPVISIGSVANGVSSQFGLGDTLQSLFFSPKQPTGGWIWGVGPAFLWPTATSDALGSGKFGIGPTGVALRQDGPWTYGVLANQIWSYAGSDNRQSVNQMYVQPFVAYTFPTYTSIGINTETTFNWANHQTSVPINLFATQILKIAGQPISVQLGPRYYARTVPGGPYWGLRFTFTILLPK